MSFCPIMLVSRRPFAAAPFPGAALCLAMVLGLGLMPRVAPFASAKQPDQPMPGAGGATVAVNAMSHCLDRMTRQLATIQDDDDLPRVMPSLIDAALALADIARQFFALPEDQQQAVAPKSMQKLQAARTQFRQQMDRLSEDPALVAQLHVAMAREIARRSDKDTAAPATPPRHAKPQPVPQHRGIHGVWVSSRFDSFTGSMIFDYITFFPDGIVYDSIAPGWDRLKLDRERLPEDRDELGRFTAQGKQVRIRWEDDKTEDLTRHAADALEFTDRGQYRHYLKVKPIAAGTRWQTTFSRSSTVRAMAAGGVSGSFGTAITFHRDGRYEIENFSSMAHEGNILGDQRDMGVATQSKGWGRYEFRGYRLRLQDAGGPIREVPCFAIDWDDEEAGINLLYIDGVGTFTR